MLRTKSTFLPKSAEYSAAIAVALRQDMKTRGIAVKTFMRWTGAGERTVNNWLGGIRGPSGTHLIALAMNSTEVHLACLVLSGREQEQMENKALAIRLLREVMILLGEETGGTD